MTSTIDRTHTSNKQSKPKEQPDNSTAEDLLKQAQKEVQKEKKTQQEPLETCDEQPDQNESKKQTPQSDKPKPNLKIRDKAKSKTGEAIQQYKDTSKKAYIASFETGKEEGEAIADIERQGSHIGYINRKAQHLIEDTVARRQALPQFREMIEIELAEAEEFDRILEGDENTENPLDRLLEPGKEPKQTSEKSENLSNSFSLFLEG